jgi:NADH dehydrogenase (ubiquinone) Fe-S protein 8
LRADFHDDLIGHSSLQTFRAQHNSQAALDIVHHNHSTMSSPRTMTALARSRAMRAIALHAARQTTFASAFSTSSQRLRLAENGAQGSAPERFRLPTPDKWNENKESVWDQAGKYFLLTEMARGMWVLMEQFFRPP